MMSFIDDNTDKTERSTALMYEIAQTLGCHMSVFLEPSPDRESQTAEMVRLWLMIEHEQDRWKVLSFLRNIAS